jgi:hypothetical protein
MMVSNYLDNISDEVLIYMAQRYWDKLEQFCMLMSLDIEIEKQGLRN